MTFGILGGGLDLVFESHGWLAMGESEVEASAHLCLDRSHDDAGWLPMVPEHQQPQDSLMSVDGSGTDFRALPLNP
jgi:hypothetical protein